jgi:hypothetical protein
MELYSSSEIITISSDLTNLIPYMYDEIWGDYLIEYYTFNGYELIKNLSIFTTSIKIIILIFKKDEKKYLFGYNDGIIFPYLNYDIYNINSDNYKKYIKKVIDNIICEIRKYYDGKIKLYNFQYYQYKLGFNLFEYLNYNSVTYFDVLNITNMNYSFDLIDNEENIIKNMRYSTRNKINQYNKKKIFQDYEIKIYFGEKINNNLGTLSINSDIFNLFVKKHFELSAKKTKSTKAWELLETLIINKKAFLVQYNNDFIYFFISKYYSYYGINACSKKSDICIVLIYEAIKFIKKNGYNFIHLGNYIKDELNEEQDKKNNDIFLFKKSMSNKMINNYYTTIE